MDKWDYRFFDLAKEVANWSKDPNCKVGAVLVAPSKRQFSIGFNGLPSNIEDKEEILNDKELKNTLVVHAEINAIANSTCSLKGWTLYITKFPCMECAKTIVAAGIICVKSLTAPHGTWYDEQISAIDFFDESGVRHDIFN